MMLQSESQSTENQRSLILDGYAEKVDIELLPYTGLDFSKLAVMFCGQGQMIPGLMAEEVRNFPLFQVHFKQLDQIAQALDLGSPSDFILKPEAVPAHRVTLYSSLCLYTLQVSMFETLQFLRYRPRILTAHSFGEFAALTAAGVIRFSEMIRFLIERQSVLAELKSEYAMFAVNDISRMQGSEIEYYIANQNTLRQSSIVCRGQDVDRLKAFFKEQKIAALKVQVEYPYHTPWLKACAVDLRSRLINLELKIEPPKIPLISSIGSQKLDKADFSETKVIDLLCEQLTTPVHFPDQIRKICAAGLAHFVELSPVDILSPFVEQILTTDQRTFKVDSFRRRVKTMIPKARSTTKFKNSKLMDVFNRALKSLSGYTVEDIHFEDRIREDLGIDSIKKAEIVFQIVDSMNHTNAGFTAPVNLSDLATFGDIIEYLEASQNSKETLAASTVTKSREFELLRKTWVRQDTVDFFGRDPVAILRVRMDQIFEHNNRLNQESDTGEILMVFEWSGEPADPVQESLRWLNYFRTHSIAARRWILVYDDSIFGAALHAMFLSLAQEQQASYKGIFDLSGRGLSDEALIRESLDFYHPDIRLTAQGERQVRHFERLSTSTSPQALAPRRALIFGGLGGVGINLIHSFGSQPLEKLTIIGRTALTESLQDKLHSLQKVARELNYVSLNVLDESSVKDFLTTVLSESESYDLIIHSVGQEVSEVLSNTTEETIATIVTGKLKLARLLTEFAQKHPEIRFVFNSSIIPEFGNAGQTPYGLVNQFLNEYARRTINIQSILWPAWDRTGMTNHDLILKSLQLLGLPVLQPEQGRALFQKALTSNEDTLYPLCYDFLTDYLSVSSSRSEFKGLFRFASKDRHLLALTGLTLSNLPYLTHHIVKKICPFPASGSLALILFKGYQERGVLGVVKNFKALNFLIVQQDQSPYFLESSYTSADVLYAQVRSSQLLAEAKIDFAASETVIPQQSSLSFSSDLELEIEFDQNVSVYIGPLFKLEQGIFEDSKSGRMVVRMDLAKTPHYSGVHIFDKLHKLFEISFNTSCLKAVRDLGLMIVPKSIQSLRIHSEHLTGTLFFVVIDEMKNESEGPLCDVTVVNFAGRPVIEIRNLRSIVVSRGEGESAKEVRERSHSHRFF